MRENKTGAAMKHASSMQVFDYWNERRGDRMAPERGDIEPGQIRRALGDTFILGQDSQGKHRFRLAGTRTCALFGNELKGADFTTLWAEAERPKLLEWLTAATVESVGFIAGVSGCTAAAAAPARQLEPTAAPWGAGAACRALLAGSDAGRRHDLRYHSLSRREFRAHSRAAARPRDG
jgi:hypothetical protein